MYQTLPEFLMAPFSKREPLKDTTYKSKYEQFKTTNKIHIENTCSINDSWYIHLKIPSESNDSISYDVVLRFFLLGHSKGRDGSLAGHKVQFFSNSPSFIYNYSWLYKSYGFLIENLYGKMEKQYLNQRPKKENLVISYDKSIYFAILYLTENHCKRLTLTNIKRLSVSEDKFFRSIDDVEYKNIERTLLNEEDRLKRLKKQIGSRTRNIGKEHKKPKTGKQTKISKTTKIVRAGGKITPTKKTKRNFR